MVHIHQTKNNKDWRKLEFSAPITESWETLSEQGNSISKIKGIAINSTTTRNGVTYLEEELGMSASTLLGRPLLKDHVNSIDNIVGKVVKASFNFENKNIEFEAEIMDESIRKKLSQGLLDSVSIGAMVKDVEESEEHGAIAKGIEFVELSLVAIPADPNAIYDITQALHESLKLKKEELEETKSNHTYKNERRINNNMDSEMTTAKAELVTLQGKLDAKEKLMAKLSEKLQAFEAKEKTELETHNNVLRESLGLNRLDSFADLTIESLKLLNSQLEELEAAKETKEKVDEKVEVKEEAEKPEEDPKPSEEPKVEEEALVEEPKEDEAKEAPEEKSEEAPVEEPKEEPKAEETLKSKVVEEEAESPVAFNDLVVEQTGKGFTICRMNK